MDPTNSVLSLVDALAVEDDIDDPEACTHPLHGLQEYFDKQFSEVQQFVSIKLEKASELLARRVRVLRTMTKQNVKLQAENKSLSEDLTNLRKMLQSCTLGTPKEAAPDNPSGGGRRNSFRDSQRRQQTPPPEASVPGTGPRRNSLGGGQRRSSLGGHKRSGTPTGNTQKIGLTRSASAAFGAKGSLKNVLPVLPVLPGLVSSNGGHCSDDAGVHDMMAALSTPPVQKLAKSPPAPQSEDPVAPAFTSAPLMMQQTSASCSTSWSTACGTDAPPPLKPATNNFVQGDDGMKDSTKCNDTPLVVTDLLSQVSDGEAERSPRNRQGDGISPKYASEKVQGNEYDINSSNWRRFSSEGREGVEAELVKRSSIDREILYRHSLTEEDQTRGSLKRSDSAPLADVIPPSGFNSPEEDMKTRRSRTASILKPPGSKKGNTGKVVNIVALTEYESETRKDESSPSLSSSESEKDDKAGASSVQSGQEFEVLQVWSTKSNAQPTCQQFKQDLRRRQSLRKMSRLMFDSAHMEELLKQHDEYSLFRMIIPFLLHPNSLKRGCWDLLSFVLLIYDIFTIPFELFDPPPTSFSNFMVWLARIFWSCDIWLSCVTGYLASDGSIILRPRAILTRYAKSWLLLDLILVGLDWMELFWIGTTSAGFARLGKASRAFRILRMLRMLRVIRLNQVIQLIDERIRSDRLMIFADIVKILLVIVGCAHFSACVWYGVGNREDDLGWVGEHLRFSHGLAYRYFVSMHWSLSQFAGGMDEVIPHNLLERVYAVGIWITAFMMAAVLTSSLTSEITRLQIISNQHAQQLSILRRFLSDNGVSNKLSVRVQRNARHVLQQQQRYMRESSVELLDLVSEPLRMELHFEIYSPLMCKHPFFNEYIEECSYVMRKVCHSCAIITPVFVGDVIFNAGEAPRPPKMYFIVSGMQEYFTIGGNQVSVREGQWLAEAVLWTNWIHRGGLRVKQDSQLCEFSAERFQEIVADSDFSLFDPRRYAEHFVKLLNTYGGGVSDLPFPRDILEEACGQRRTYQSQSEKTELLSKEEVMNMARSTKSPEFNN